MLKKLHVGDANDDAVWAGQAWQAAADVCWCVVLPVCAKINFFLIAFFVIFVPLATLQSLCIRYVYYIIA